jgi:flavin-dependent dehydrogenase
MEPVHYVVDRDKINQSLLEAGRGQGVIYEFGKEIINLPGGFSNYIFCDGAYSRAEKELEMSQGNFNLGIQFLSEEKDSSNYVQTWARPDGFYWRIPRGEGVEYGVMGKPKGLIDDFEAFCQKQNWPYKREKIQSAIIPQGLRKIVADDIAVCGDAAGLCKPWSGGGVIWGLTAADILVESFPDLDKYNKKVQALFLPAIARGYLAKNLASFLGFNLPFLLPSKYRRDNDFPLF